MNLLASKYIFFSFPWILSCSLTVSFHSGLLLLYRENIFLNLSKDTSKNFLKACFTSWILLSPRWLDVYVHLLAIGLPQLSGSPWSSYHIYEWKTVFSIRPKGAFNTDLLGLPSSLGLYSEGILPPVSEPLWSSAQRHPPPFITSFLTWVSLLPGLSVNMIPPPLLSSRKSSKSLLWINQPSSHSWHLKSVLYSMISKHDGI